MIYVETLCLVGCGLACVAGVKGVGDRGEAKKGGGLGRQGSLPFPRSRTFLPSSPLPFLRLPRRLVVDSFIKAANVVNCVIS